MVQLFAALGGAAKRALFRQYVYGRLRPGIAAEVILKETRDIGISIRRTDALSIIREVTGREISRSRLRFVPDIRIPSIEQFTPTRLRLEKRFQTIFEVRGTNVLTGAPQSRRVSFISDERVSLGDMKRQLLERAQSEYSLREGVDYRNIVAVEGLIREEPPYT
ncbi:hypothetical protein LCGC14_0779090 [marine sediment metagenome]|uniref:Uncharacterized protein n=1 Tax=marine sediment metagenome TaxID=412755 RepID=A0A0F9PWA2_9ZZZZ